MADAIPTMTSNVAPSGTASASSSLSGTYYAYKAMDDNGATWWSTTSAGVTPCWLMYDWGAYQPMIVTSYTITARSGSGNQAGAPKTFKLQGYNGSTYTDLDTPADQTAWGDGEKRTFNFANTTSYRGYRLYVTVNNGGTYTEVAEFELLLGAAKPRLELAGIQALAKDPRCRIALAGIQALAKDARCRIALAGVQVMWVEIPVVPVDAGATPLAGTSALTANATQEHAGSAVLAAVSSLRADRLQWRGGYVPAATLLDPYPIPMLWQYVQRGLNPADPFQQGVFEWSKQISQWCEEHVTRVYREVSRMTTEKASDWVSI